MNLAGPRAREILARPRPTLDCSNEAFAYLDAQHAPVAGVPCLLLRIGFVGEVGYEIHCPAPHGEHAVGRARAAGGRTAAPFGLEPQRILRLQKLHILVGQDTDSESTPFGAAMPWIVKLDKEEDFIGRWALEHAAEHPARDRARRLHHGRRRRADRGRGRPAPSGGPPGQVTSSRRSPQLGAGRSAWPGCRRRWPTTAPRSRSPTRARRSPPTVTTKPFYDPEGEVLRS